MVKCGKCKEQHQSANEVRNCYLGTNLPTDRTSAGLPQRHDPNNPSVNEWHKGEEERAQEFLNASSENVMPAQALHRDFKTLAAQLPDLKNARYAVEVDGELKFYRVDKPQEGRWFGYAFIKVQASDVLYPIRNTDSRVKILEAMLRYGREIGACGHCGRTLTNEESRQAGIGPICRNKMEW